MRRLSLSLAVAMLVAAGAAAAQQPAASVTITLLGTAGGPPAHVDRSQPATLLTIGDHRYLVDAGENAGQQLLRAGVPTSRLTTTFITHLHWDHTLGLGYVMATGWMLGRTVPLPIVGPPGTAEYVGRELAALQVGEDLFRAETPDKPPLRSLYPVHEEALAGPAQVYADAAVRVTAVPTTHYAALPPVRHPYGADQAFAYRFDGAGVSVVFTGDTGPSPAVTALARGADVLVAEICDVDSIHAAMLAVQPGARLDALVTHMQAEHLSPEAVGRMASDAGVRKLVLTHYVMGPHYDPQRFVERIRPFYKGEIVVGQDLLTVDVVRR